MTDVTQVGFKCPHCLMSLRASSMRGKKRIRCPNCTLVVDLAADWEKLPSAVRPFRRWAVHAAIITSIVLLASLNIYLIYFRGHATTAEAAKEVGGGNTNADGYGTGLAAKSSEKTKATQLVVGDVSKSGAKQDAPIPFEIPAPKPEKPEATERRRQEFLNAKREAVNAKRNAISVAFSDLINFPDEYAKVKFIKLESVWVDNDTKRHPQYSLFGITVKGPKGHVRSGYNFPPVERHYLTFTTSETFGRMIDAYLSGLNGANAFNSANLYCEIMYLNDKRRSESTFPVANIYKLEILNGDNKVLRTAEEE